MDSGKSRERTSRISQSRKVLLGLRTSRIFTISGFQTNSEYSILDILSLNTFLGFSLPSQIHSDPLWRFTVEFQTQVARNEHNLKFTLETPMRVSICLANELPADRRQSLAAESFAVSWLKRKPNSMYTLAALSTSRNTINHSNFMCF